MRCSKKVSNTLMCVSYHVHCPRREPVYLWVACINIVFLFSCFFLNSGWEALFCNSSHVRITPEVGFTCSPISKCQAVFYMNQKDIAAEDDTKIQSSIKKWTTATQPTCTNTIFLVAWSALLARCQNYVQFVLQPLYVYWSHWKNSTNPGMVSYHPCLHRNCRT